MNLKNGKSIFYRKTIEKYFKTIEHIRSQDKNKRTKLKVREGVYVNVWVAIAKPKLKHLKETIK